MKTEMTSFDVAVLVSELNQAVRGARIDNIYQLNSRTILLKLRQPAQSSLHLLIEAGKRLHLTSYVLKKPEKPPAFCMALRKHLVNGKIMGVQQHEFERIVTVYIGAREGNFQLVVELFGDGNIILVNPQNLILYALTYKRMRDRNILRGEIFQHAPSSGKNPFLLSRLQFNDVKSFGQLEIVKALTKFLSIGGLYAEEILLRAEVDKNFPCEALTEKELDRIFIQLGTILSHISTGKTEACIVVDKEREWIDATPIRLKKYVNLNQKAYKTFNEALDEYYTETAIIEKISEAEREIERESARLKRALQSQQKTLDESRREMEQNKRIGDIIYTHFGGLQLLLQKFMQEKQSGKTWEQIVSGVEKEKGEGHIPALYFHSLDSKRLILTVTLEGTTFPLDINRSIQANAANYYNRAKRAEKKLKGAEKALRETEIKIQELQQRLMKRAEEVRELPPKRRERVWYEKFRWFYSSEGFLVIGGRDASSNEVLIKKYMEPNDIVFHADILGAPFVLIKTEEKNPSEQTIAQSAQMAASYSRAWKEMLGAVDVYWVHPEQVSKSPPPGQYLTKGSFMIHGIKNYVRKVPLRVAIGVQMKDDRVAVIGCPADAIKKQASVYVEIVPGQQTSSALAKQVRHLLATKAPKKLQKQILEIPVEEIQVFIPSGRGMVIFNDEPKRKT